MAPVNSNDSARLAQVERYRKSGALGGEKLVRFVNLTASIFGFENALISTHHEHLQICHVRAGKLGATLPRERTICRVPVESGETLVVHDLTKDERFKDIPEVVGNPSLRFYAGAPLIAPSGHCIGALCLLDTKPRQFSHKDTQLLTELACFAIEHMELVRVTEEAKYDPLTGLRNRPFLLAAIQASIDAGNASSVLLIDLDGFKEINDSLGHACGDEALTEVAERLGEFAGDCRVIARLGGDEFVIFLDGEADPIAASKVARAVVARLAEPFTVRGYVVHFGASVGVALRTVEAEAIQILGNADLAMYQAKQEGRNCYRHFTRDMRNVALERGNVVLEMQDAWEGGSFELYYQPIVRLSDGAWTGAEALLRWNYPYRGVLPPAMFLPILEKSHLAVDVGGWVIDEACRQVAIWRKRFAPDFKIAVNLFALQFNCQTLVDRVCGALARHGLPPAALQLELTERIILAEDPRILEQVRQLRAMGVGIAFDDFGTGFASLAALRHYPVSCIKIDRSFISGIGGSAADRTIVNSLIGLSRSLSLETVAEGIETSEQRAIMAEQEGLDAQGFLFAKPQPASLLEAVWSCQGDEFEAKLRA
ncbi:sensor domain-containing phosphodiesterase [Jiella mangrovi]|uniref:Sensor domain-containing phosphodiesterase n=1 Tax=Jiella mangrovi TaxID=2821407 RepID=A0ABS4BKV0_9HYPH|nr:sensor domain-containing phosphodiesterase [Jiella mangrovi]MBP0617296.1 sensor domain-containing phosphodiesterase [Jiella mangrovi]